LTSNAKGETEHAWKAWESARATLGPDSAFAKEPEATENRVRQELQEETMMDTLIRMRRLLAEDKLFELLTVAVVAGIHPQAVVSARGQTLLFKAPSAEAVHLLAGNLGLDVTQQSDEGSTAMHRACKAEVVEALVAYGADVNAANNGRTTPLFYANSAAVALAMLAAGADATAVNVFSHCPLHLAASHGRWQVVWLLLRAGADCEQQGSDGLTPLVLTNKIMRGVPGPDGRISFPQNLAELQRTKSLLEIYAQCLAVPRISRPFLRFEQAVATKDLSVLCQHPLQALAASSRIPVELLTVVVVRFVSAFRSESRVADGPEEDGKSAGWHRPITSEVVPVQSVLTEALPQSRTFRAGATGMGMGWTKSWPRPELIVPMGFMTGVFFLTVFILTRPGAAVVVGD